MGVKHLWSIIDEAKSKQTLDYLRGKVISVDLSIWIVEAIKTLQFNASILKPHLRNIFYRVINLRRLGVKLIFVTEGEPPELKQETMRQRNFQQYGVKTTAKKKVGRSRFQRIIDECCKMLDLMGIPYIQAAGEAEDMCAQLSKHGFTDGCLTNDGDFLLYGGQVVYRDFGIDPKDPHVFVYTMENIKQRTGLTVKDMIGLALVCGCDYSDGVTGVGRTTINKFLDERSFEEDFITRFKSWLHKDTLPTNISKSEATIIKKALKMENFYNQKIIDEYLTCKDDLSKVRKKLRWGYPNVKGIQDFLLDKLEWPIEYTLSKVLQVSTSTYLEKLSDGTYYPVPITPESVVKTRCQQGVSLVEIKWRKYDNGNETYSKRWEGCPEEFVTLENQQVVVKVLPELVDTYSKMKEEKKQGSKTKSKRKAKKKEDTGEIASENTCDVTSQITENDVTDQFCEDFKQLKTKSSEKCGLETNLYDEASAQSNTYGETSIPKKNLSTNCDNEDSDLDDGYLPLSQRITLKKMKEGNSKNIKNGNSKNDNSNSVKEENSKTIKNNNCSVNDNNLYKSRESEIYTNIPHISNKPLKENMSICLDEKPLNTFENENIQSDVNSFLKPCSDISNMSTPVRVKDDVSKLNEVSPKAKEKQTRSGEFSITPIVKKKSNSIDNIQVINTRKSYINTETQLPDNKTDTCKDVTNSFSELLSDSILCDSLNNLSIAASPCMLDLKKSYESSLRQKFCQSLKLESPKLREPYSQTPNGRLSVKENVEENTSPDISVEEINNISPMCLSDRLKLLR